MTDYISRKDLLHMMQVTLDRLPQGVFNPNKIGFIAAMEGIKNFPAADVREVVYCKDCVYSQAWYADKRMCRFWNEEDGNSVFNDGFCNYGAKTYADASTAARI